MSIATDRRNLLARIGMLTRKLAGSPVTAPARSDLWQLDSAAHRRLVVAWLGLSFLAFGVSALFGLVLVALRIPGVGGGEAAVAGFRAALVLHVVLANLIWLLSMASALWALNGGARWLPLRWLFWGFALIGVLALPAAPLVLPGPVLLSNYVPAIDSPLFFGGLLVFAVAVTASAAATLIPRRGWLEALGAHPASAASLIAAACVLVAAASTAMALISLHGVRDPAYMELVTWGGAHLLQFVFSTLLVAAWLVVIPSEALPGRVGLRIILALVLVQALFAAGGLLLHRFDVASPAYRKGFTWLMSAGSWIAALPIGLWLIAIRRRWWSLVPQSVALGLASSILLFIAGCGLGAFIRADDALVPAHYHGTVGAVTLALMTLVYHWNRRRDSDAPDSVAWPLVLYASGMTTMVAGLSWAGALGLPRKLAGVQLGENAGQAIASAAISGFGGLLAVVGVGWFSVLALRRLNRFDVAQPLVAPQPSRVSPSVPRRADARPRALLVVSLGILSLGAALSIAPVGGPGASGVAAWIAERPAIDRISSQSEQRQRELTTRFAQGVTMLQAGEFDFAMTAFHRVLQIDPKMPEAHVNLGFALLGLKEFRAARDFFEGALALRKRQVNAYYGLAIAYEGMGDLELALGSMRAYEHLAPPDDPYRRKAAGAIWEWEERLAAKRAPGTPSADGKRPAPAKEAQ